MKFTRFLLALLIVVPFLQSCQADIEDLDDPRDAIVKMWRVTDDSPVGSTGYDVTIRKDATDKTRVLFDNFHGLGTGDDLYATLAGTTLTIPSQTLDGTYIIVGQGTIASNLETIVFNYSVDEEVGNPVNYVANFGPVVTVKKKKAQAKKAIQ